MSVLETIEVFKDGLMWIGLSALAAIAVGVVGAWLCRRFKELKLVMVVVIAEG